MCRSSTISLPPLRNSSKHRPSSGLALIISMRSSHKIKVCTTRITGALPRLTCCYIRQSDSRSLDEFFICSREALRFGTCDSRRWDRLLRKKGFLPSIHMCVLP
jgi:hypothetical protein